MGKAIMAILVFLMAADVLVSAQELKYALKGQEINLVPSIVGKPQGIVWVHDGEEVVFFHGTEERVFPPYENRTTLDRASAEITIQNATYEDSGEYYLEVLINKHLDSVRYRVEVIDKVSKPSISCETSDTNQVTLVCSTESKQPHLLEFKWSSRGNEQTGPNVTITVRNEDDDHVYRCDVSNPLTNQMASFTVKDCFLDEQLDTRPALLIFAAIFIMFVMLSCVLYRKRQHLRVSFEKRIRNRRERALEVSQQRDGISSFLQKESTLLSSQRLSEVFFSEEQNRSDSDMNAPPEFEVFSESLVIHRVAFGQNVRSEGDLLSRETLNRRRVEGIRRNNTWSGPGFTHGTMKEVSDLV